MTKPARASLESATEIVTRVGHLEPIYARVLVNQADWEDLGSVLQPDRWPEVVLALHRAGHLNPLRRISLAWNADSAAARGLVRLDWPLFVQVFTEVHAEFALGGIDLMAMFTQKIKAALEQLPAYRRPGGLVDIVAALAAQGPWPPALLEETFGPAGAPLWPLFRLPLEHRGRLSADLQARLREAERHRHRGLAALRGVLPRDLVKYTSDRA